MLMIVPCCPPFQALLEEKTAAVRAGEASLEKGKGKDLLSMVGQYSSFPCSLPAPITFLTLTLGWILSPSEHGTLPPSQRSDVRC
jgi:hypothetical protein